MSNAPSSSAVRRARFVYGLAGLYGLAVLLPLFFVEALLARYAPPALAHPEYYYGFIGAAATMQLVYLVIAADPVRYRPLMPVAVVAKLNFVAAIAWLFAAGRLEAPALALPAIDGLIGLAFAWAWLQMRRTEGAPRTDPYRTNMQERPASD